MLITRLFEVDQSDVQSVKLGLRRSTFIQIMTLLVTVQCDTCDLSTCSDCSADNINVCSACINPGYGFSFDNSSCIPCQENCTQCVTASECTVCAKAGEGPLQDGSGACAPCSAQCFQCSEAGQCDVNSCNNFFASNSSNGQCEPCSVNCESCALNGPGKCDICLKLSGIDWSTYTPGERPLPCKRCEDPHCVSCYGNYQDCDACSFKYYQKDGYRCEAVNTSFQAYPLFGPVSGGTTVTISLNQLTGVSIVYFNNYSSPARSTNDSRFITTLSPFVNTTGSLLIALANNGGDQLSTNLSFVTKPNPVIMTILPRNHLTSGGTLVTISGRYFTSIAASPKISITVVVTRVGTNNQVAAVSQTSTFAYCQVDDITGELMTCPMPPLNLPSDFQDQLVKDTTSHERIVAENAPNEVDYLVGLNGLDKADIYVSVLFDAYKFYQNINKTTLSDVQFLFYPPPVLATGIPVICIITNSTQLLHITGTNMMKGSQMIDYSVSIGSEECLIQTLTDSELTCLPPSLSPTQNTSSAHCCFCTTNGSLDIVVSIGYKTYQYACAEYQPSSVAVLKESVNHVPLIIGLVVGIGGAAIVIIIVVTGITIYQRRQPKQLLTNEVNSAEANIKDYVTRGLTWRLKDRTEFRQLYFQTERYNVPRNKSNQAVSSIDKNEFTQSNGIAQGINPVEANISDYITHGLTQGSNHRTEFGKLYFSQPENDNERQNKRSPVMEAIEDIDTDVIDATDA